MLQILVTGGCGFIGSNFIRYLLDSSPRIAVVCLDVRAPDGPLGRLGDVIDDPRLRYVRCDVVDCGMVRRVFAQGLTVVVNCAEVHGDGEVDAEAACMRSNVAGTQVLLDAARDFRVPRFLQLSTGSVYGSAARPSPVREEAEPRPTGAYATSKAAADHLVRGYAQACGIGAVVARTCPSYGPYQSPDRPLPRFIARVLRGESATVPGDGSRFGDWMHIADLCGALDRLWRHGRTGEIYHVCAGRPRSDWDLTQAVLTAVGRPRVQPRAQAMEANDGRPAILDGEKIERSVGWRSLIPLDRGLRHTVHWYRSHPAWACADVPVRRAS